MDDFLEPIRIEQSRIAVEIADDLMEEFRPHLRSGKLSRIDDYVHWDWGRDLDESIESVYLDNDIAEAMLEQEIVHHSVAAVKGYSDWLIIRMVRSNEYNLPKDDEIDKEAIMKRYDIPPGLLDRTIKYMNSLDELPLIGYNHNGRFSPNHTDLNKWKNLYNLD